MKKNVAFPFISVLLLLIILSPVTVSAKKDLARVAFGGYKANQEKGTNGDAIAVLDHCSPTYTKDGKPLEVYENCIVFLYLEDEQATSEPVADFVEITNLQNAFVNQFVDTEFDSISGLNNWTITGNNVTGFTITPPNGKYTLKKGERPEVAQVVLKVDIAGEDCKANFQAEIEQRYPTCELYEGNYYNNDGDKIDKATYEKECNPKCEFKDNKYYNQNGQEVDKTTFEKECNPKCEFKNNKYYNQSGQEIDKETYEKECNPKCEFKDNKYYNQSGQEVDKTTFEKECNPKCKFENNKYYNQNGQEIDKATYEKECNPKCRIENNKYYDDKGKEVTKEEWDARCTEVENPKTGIVLPIVILGIGGIGGGAIYYYTKHKKIYKL